MSARSTGWDFFLDYPQKICVARQAGTPHCPPWNSYGELAEVQATSPAMLNRIGCSHAGPGPFLDH